MERVSRARRAFEQAAPPTRMRPGDSRIGPVLAVAITLLALGGRAAAKSLVVEVQSGNAERFASPVWLTLPKALDDHSTFTLQRIDDGAEIPVQIEPGSPRRLVWIVAKKLAAGSKRRYRLVPGKKNAAARGERAVQCHDDGKGLDIKVNGKRVLRYNHAIVNSPDPKTPYYARSGYIHPLVSPAGATLTDDMAPDHPHQHGMFFAWTKATYDGRAINFWDQKAKTARVEHARLNSTSSGPVHGGFAATIRHSDLTSADGPRPVLSETWTVRVYRLEKSYLFDLTSEQKIIGKKPLRVEKYHYGGFAIRCTRKWLEKGRGDFLTSKGKSRNSGNHTRPTWCDIFGTIGGRKCGATLIPHPSNFRSPQFVRLHPSKPYFCFSPMVDKPFVIRPGTPYRSSFRIHVHDDAVDVDTVERLAKDFASPPVAQIVKN